MTTKIGSVWRAVAVTGLATAALPVMAAMHMPDEQHQGPVGFITGGVGQSQARMFEKQITKHPLAIELLQHAGKAEEFTADATIKIIDRQGRTVLDAKAGGPFMLVDLAPGRYSIQATLKNDTLRKSAVAVVRDKTARATFEFPPRTDG